MNRALDLVGAGVACVVAALPMVAIGMAIRWRMGGPVLFRQERIGRHGTTFVMWKFRTMTSDVGPDGELLGDVERLTPLGRFLRATSLDELPELINVLLGDMSLVGPRPLVTEYLPHFTAHQARRHDVRPGMTGWAQVNGRNAITWEEKFKLDVWYVDNRSLALDAKILAKTVWQVVFRRGTAVGDTEPAEPFRPASRGDAESS